MKINIVGIDDIRATLKGDADIMIGDDAITVVRQEPQVVAAPTKGSALAQTIDEPKSKQPEFHQQPTTLILEAVAHIRRVGAQACAKVRRDDLRNSNPDVAKMIESFPGYLDPDSPDAADDVVQITVEYTKPSGSAHGTYFFVPLRLLTYIKSIAAGKKVYEYRDSDSQHQFSFDVKPSIISDMLTMRGQLPQGTICVNDKDWPDQKMSRSGLISRTWDEVEESVKDRHIAAA